VGSLIKCFDNQEMGLRRMISRSEVFLWLNIAQISNRKGHKAIIPAKARIIHSETTIKEANL
jgi:hypothetical protein